MNIQVTESALWWHEDEFRVDSEREDNSGRGGCADRWTVKHQEENDWKPALESFNLTEMRGNAEAPIGIGEGSTHVCSRPSYSIKSHEQRSATSNTGALRHTKTACQPPALVRRVQHMKRRSSTFRTDLRHKHRNICCYPNGSSVIKRARGMKQLIARPSFR